MKEEEQSKVWLLLFTKSYVRPVTVEVKVSKAPLSCCKKRGQRLHPLLKQGVTFGPLSRKTGNNFEDEVDGKGRLCRGLSG